MACDLPAPDRRAGIDKRRVGFAVMAGTLAAVGIALDTTQAANLLFLAAGLIFAAGFGIPVATAAEGGPPIGKLVVALFDREHERLTKRALEDRLLDTLTVVTGDVTLHEPRAIRLVGQAVEQAAARWRGPIGPALYNYLLCCAVELAVQDPWDPPIGPDHPQVRLKDLTRPERAILALRRCKVDAADIAKMLDWPLKDVVEVADLRPWSER